MWDIAEHVQAWRVAGWDFDVPLLERALRMPLAFVGALGSRATQRERAERLRAAGLSAAEIARLRAPIGLDLGGRTAEETAVAVAAEIIASARGGSGLPLTGGDGAIHRNAGDPVPAARPAASGRSRARG